VGVAGAVWLDQKASLSGVPGQGGQFGLFTADAFGCYAVVQRPPFEVSPCGLVELGRMTATPFGTLSRSSPVTAYYPALGLGARARWEVTRYLGLALEIDAVVPLPQQGFSIDVQGTLNSVYSTSVVAGRLFLGPEVRF
jgi:hypothetical protein